MTIAVIVAKTSRATTRASFAASNGKESANASVGIKKKTSSKNKRSRRDTWNARHARDTRSTNSASESTGSVRDTVPNKTKQARGTTTANTILFDSTHKKRMWVVMCCIALALVQEQSHKTFGEKFKRRS